MSEESSSLRTLLVEDSATDASLLVEALRRGGYRPHFEQVDTEDALRHALESAAWDIVICDYALPQFDAPAAIRIIREKCANLPIIVVSGAIGEEAAVETLKMGANDYLLKGNLTRLVPTVQREVREAASRRQHRLAAAGHREAEEALSRIKLAVEYASDAISIVDAAGHAVFLNRAHTELFGYQVDELNAIGGPAALFINQGIAEEATSAVCSSGFWAGEAFLRTRAGRVVELFIRTNAIKNAGQEAIAYIGVATDVGEIKRAQRTIAEQAALLDQAQDAIMVNDLRGCFRFWNKGAERIFGWTAAEAIGRRLQDFLNDTDAHEDAMATVLQKGAWSGELTKRTKDKRDVLIEGRWTLVRDEFGDPKSVLAIETDITEKRTLESQFLRAQRMESIGTLAGGIAHDLNNVLGPIIMAVDLLKLTMTEPKDLDLLDTVEVSARRGADMVKQVLSFARGIEGERLLLQPARLLKEVQKIVRETFPKSIVTQLSAPEDVWSFLGDPTQLHQVLLNLCVNARDAMPSGGRLRLSAGNLRIDAQYAAMHAEARPGAYVVLDVSDNGTGMVPEVAERIFEPFFTTKDVGSGTGLGLSTTLAIARSHGGFITFETALGKGTKFSVHLPAESESTGVLPGGTMGELPRGHGECILVIDDEASIRSITAQTLDAFGYRVLTASDGAEGVAKYAQHMADVAAVLTDMMMPVMGGVVTIRALTKLNPAVKIIAASGFTEKNAEADAAAMGVKMFLFKPFTAATLLTTLRDVLRPKPVVE